MSLIFINYDFSVISLISFLISTEGKNKNIIELVAKINNKLHANKAKTIK